MRPVECLTHPAPFYILNVLHLQNGMAVPLVMLISLLSGEAGIIFGSSWVRSCHSFFTCAQPLAVSAE